MKNLALALEKTDFVIANYSTKIELLKLRNTKPWLNFKILTPSEVISLFLGSASERTLNFIADKNHLSYFHAKIINANIIFPTSSNATLKTKELSLIREQLLRDGFFDDISLAKLTFFQKKVLLSPELKANSLLINLLKSADCALSYFPSLKEQRHSLITFENGIIEIYSMLNTIARLMADGTPPQAIKVVTRNNTFQKLIRAFAPSFNLKFESEKVSLAAFPEVKVFLNELENDERSFRTVLDNFTPGLNKPLLALKSLYLGLEQASFPKVGALAYFRELVKEKKVKFDEGECISFSNELPLFSFHDDHFFIPNFAQGSFSITSSSPYLSNKEKSLLGLNDALATGEEGELLLTNSLTNIKNIYLSFAPHLDKDDYALASVAEKLKLTEVKFTKDNVFYSQGYLNYVTGNDLDTRMLFNKLNHTLSYYCFFNSDFSAYRSFNYSFKGINYTPDNVYLSYSRINTYQRNPFDYFAQYLLGLSEEFGNAKLNFGNFVHAILEHSHDEATFRFNFLHFLDQGEYSAKERFYIENRKDFIFKVFQNYLSYVDYSKPDKILTEEPLKVLISADCQLEGRIDNLFIYERSETKYLLVVDYKTGTIHNKEKNYSLGLDLQLPLYGLLLNLSPQYHDATISGLVLSSLKLPSYSLDSETILSETAAKVCRFTGSIVEGVPLSVIDPDLGVESDYFAGVKRTKGSIFGTISQARLSEHIKIAEEKVGETYEAIKNSNFPVMVKMVDKANFSDYGTYRNVSYLPAFELGEDMEEDGDEDE